MLFDIDIEVGGEKLTVQNVEVGGDGTFNTCACNGQQQQKRVDGVWTPTYLILSVGDETVGQCGSDCNRDQEIAKGQMYIFEQWVDDNVVLDGRHANFDTTSGVMKFAFTDDGNDTVEFIDAQGPTIVKFKAHEDKVVANPEAQPNTAPTTEQPTTTVRVDEEKAPEEQPEAAQQPTAADTAGQGGATTVDGKPVDEKSTGVLVGVYGGDEW